MLLYIDVIVITSSDSFGIYEVITDLSMVFDIKDMGHLSHFLGLEMVKVQQDIFLSQTKYAKDLLVKQEWTVSNQVVLFVFPTIK